MALGLPDCEGHVTVFKGRKDCKFLHAAPDKAKECRICVTLDPPRTRFPSSMESTLTRLDNMLNAKEAGVTIGWAEGRKDLPALFVMLTAREKARERKREIEKANKAKT
jgi:hypothetical protein